MIWALHGAVGMADDWRQLAAFPAIRESAGEIRRLDLWRFLECCPMPLSQIGNTLAEEITRIDPTPTLLGYSMGGRLALHALLARPGMWKSAMIVSAHTGLDNEEDRVDRRRKDAEWSARALKGEWSEFLEQWGSQAVLQAGDSPSHLPSRLPLKSRRASVARSFTNWSLGGQEDLSARLGEITCPVTWVTGEEDEKFTAIGRRAVAELQQGHHEVVSDCGHRVPWDQPEKFAEICRNMIESDSLR